jgi:hypothetical protein
MSSWDELSRELDAWQSAGRIAEFWWRDDDAGTVTPALTQLIDLQHRHLVPLALAVIPARATADLAARLANEPNIVVVQHGWAHLNHAAPGQSKRELGPERPASYVLGELTRGALVLDRLFGPAWLKMLVPPHNRIAPAVAQGLAAAGYCGLSTDKPRRAAPTGLVQINTHVDIMNWAKRTFLGEGACIDLALTHLRDRRERSVDAAEPTGLLTHHLAHDDDACGFADRFLGHVKAHPAARWRHPRELFAAAPRKGPA